MAEFKRERVLFHVVGQGSIEIEYEVGAETAAEKFLSLFNRKDHRVSTLHALAVEADMFEYALRTNPESDDECPDCEGTGMVMHGPNEITCGTCEGAKTYGGGTEVDRAVEASTGEAPPF